ncbi:MAG: hypothetical protein P4L92_13090 [Rudaea sp.]|nr:hypothetical protein [Rudaea sp.]
MCGRIIAFSLIVASGNAVHAGEIFRCVAANGDAMYTNMACPANSKVQHVASYTPVPDVPAPAYSKPSFAAAANVRQQRDAAQQAYQAGYEQAQDESSYDDEGEYAAGWIPFYPIGRSRFHEHHRHPRQAMIAHAPHASGAAFAFHH